MICVYKKTLLKIYETYIIWEVMHIMHSNKQKPYFIRFDTKGRFLTGGDKNSSSLQSILLYFNTVPVSFKLYSQECHYLHYTY